MAASKLLPNIEGLNIDPVSYSIYTDLAQQKNMNFPKWERQFICLSHRRKHMGN